MHQVLKNTISLKPKTENFVIGRAADPCKGTVAVVEQTSFHPDVISGSILVPTASEVPVCLINLCGQDITLNKVQMVKACVIDTHTESKRGVCTPTVESDAGIKVQQSSLT